MFSMYCCDLILVDFFYILWGHILFLQFQRMIPAGHGQTRQLGGNNSKYNHNKAKQVTSTEGLRGYVNAWGGIDVSEFIQSTSNIVYEPHNAC